jgi:hypothetical protein
MKTLLVPKNLTTKKMDFEHKLQLAKPKERRCGTYLKSEQKNENFLIRKERGL